MDTYDTYVCVCTMSVMVSIICIYICMCVFARDELVPVAIDQTLMAVLVKLTHTGWRNSVVQ